ncbi:UNVERIFIED_CONTAM: Flavonoid 3'-monooxygenase [Sesamum angustifolium]|uniref:Flavonoid 3'-monooxygenase n=1 Tax=Sesamum angustifolium TaxID=2727405 RepID=A0AAW2ITE9_9LAMI
MDPFAGVALLATVFILSIGWMLKRTSQEAPHPLPPGPRGLPILGPPIRPYLQVQARKQALHGDQLAVLVKEVVRDHDAVFANRDAPIAALIASYGGNDVVWTDYDSHWRMMRKIFSREMLSNSNIEGSYHLRRGEVRRAVGDVYSNIGTPVDVGQVTFFIELNVIMSMIWGSTIEGAKRDRIGEEYWGVVSKLVDLLGKPNVSDYFPGLARFDVQGIAKEMKGYVQCVDRIVDEVLKERMGMAENAKIDEGKKDFLQTLIDLKERRNAETSINMTELRALLMDTVVGGTDTTSTIIQWVMAELLNHKEKLHRVQKELSDLIGLNTVVEESHLPKLRYLDAVVKETLRLHPAVPLLLPRRPSQSCVVGGYTIPRNTTVFLNVWSIQRDPSLWDNPLEFNPERFLNGTDQEWDFHGNNFQYAPFGSGRRVCAGVALAERTLMYILASLLHSFEWRLPDGEDVDLTEKLGLVLRKRTPLIAIPRQAVW